MSRIYQSVTSWIYKKPAEPEDEANTPSTNGKRPEDMKENDAPELSSDKKTDEVIEPSNQPGIVWRLGSGVYNTTTGAVGAGFSGVKWVAEKGYNAGAAVVSTGASVVKKVPLPSKKKDKDD